MTSPVARLYVVVVGILAFFLAWMAVAARPWATSTPKATAQDPRLAALTARQQRIQAESVRVQRIVARRWAVYHRALAARNQTIAVAQTAPAAPRVRVVNLPPLVVTRVS